MPVPFDLIDSLNMFQQGRRGRNNASATQGLLPMIMHRLDLKTALLDETCGRRLWYEQYEGGNGIMPTNNRVEREVFATVADDFRTLAFLRDQDLSATSLDTLVQDILGKLTPEQREDVCAMEALYRRLGWFIAYASFMEPIVRQFYATIPIPPEVELVKDQLVLTVPTGRLLREKATSKLTYRTYVPTSHIHAQWRNSWPYRIQPHLEMLAVQEVVGMKIDTMRVVGLSMGFKTDDSLTHPYVHGYYNTEERYWSHNFMIAKGDDWEERPIWEHKGGLVPWVLSCGKETAERQFPMSTNVILNERLTNAWLAARLHRERELRAKAGASTLNPTIRAIVFPQDTRSCAPLNAPPCPFQDVCWAVHEGEMPMGFVSNIPPEALITPTTEAIVVH